MPAISTGATSGASTSRSFCAARHADPVRRLDHRRVDPGEPGDAVPQDRQQRIERQREQRRQEAERRDAAADQRRERTAAADRTARAAPARGSSGPGWRSPARRARPPARRADQSASGRRSRCPSASAADRQQRRARRAVGGTRASASRKRSCAPALRSRVAPARAAPRPAPAPPSPPSPAQQRRGRRVGDDPPRLHHQHAVGEQQRLGHVVRDHHRGQPEPVVQRADRACRARRASPDRARRTARPSAAASRPVASARATPTRWRCPPDSASGIRVGDVARQLDQVEQLADASPVVCCPASRSADRDILGDGQVREQPDVLEDIADPPAQQRRGLGRRRRAPSIATRPALGSTSRLTVLSSVDLPDPDAADQRDEAARRDRRATRRRPPPSPPDSAW